MPEETPTTPARVTLGRFLHYQLTAENAAQINRRRTTSASIADRMTGLEGSPWPVGAQAHIGNKVDAGDVYPMVVVRVFPDGTVNGQVFLDGTDVLWVNGVQEGQKPGAWGWPIRT